MSYSNHELSAIMAVFGPGQHSQHIQNPQFETFESVQDPMYPFFGNIANVLKIWYHLNVIIYGAHGARGI